MFKQKVTCRIIPFLFQNICIIFYQKIELLIQKIYNKNTKNNGNIDEKSKKENV